MISGVWRVMRDAWRRATLGAALATLAACFHGKLPPQEFYRLHLP